MLKPETTNVAQRRALPGVLILVVVLKACGGGEETVGSGEGGGTT